MEAVISAIDLKRIIRATKSFTDRLSGGVMAYANIVVKDGVLTVTALDGHKVSIEKADVKSDVDFNCYIKPHLIGKIGKCEKCSISLIENYAYVTIGDIRQGFKQPEGEYYKIDKVINREDNEYHYVGVSPMLMKQIMESIDGDVCVLRIAQDNKKPILITDKKGNERILMPVRVCV